MILSCLVTPSLASRTRKTTSTDSIAFLVRTEEKKSSELSILLCRFKPAVSYNLNFQSSSEFSLLKSKSNSTVSRVVPGTSLTIKRSISSNRLHNDDFPTLGRPIKAIRVLSLSPSIGRILLMGIFD